MGSVADSSTKISPSVTTTRWVRTGRFAGGRSTFPVRRSKVEACSGHSTAHPRASRRPATRPDACRCRRSPRARPRRCRRRRWAVSSPAERRPRVRASRPVLLCARASSSHRVRGLGSCGSARAVGAPGRRSGCATWLVGRPGVRSRSRPGWPNAGDGTIGEGLSRIGHARDAMSNRLLRLAASVKGQFALAARAVTSSSHRGQPCCPRGNLLAKGLAWAGTAVLR